MSWNMKNNGRGLKRRSHSPPRAFLHEPDSRAMGEEAEGCVLRVYRKRSDSAAQPERRGGKHLV